MVPGKKSLYRVILPKKQTPTTGRLVKYVCVMVVVGAVAPRATDRDRRSGRDETSRRFSVQKRRDVGHRTGPWPGRILRLSSWEKSLFFNSVRRHPASECQAFRMNGSKISHD